MGEPQGYSVQRRLGGLGLEAGAEFQHPLDGTAGTGGYFGCNLNFRLQRLKAGENFLQRDALHVRAEHAGAHELHARVCGGDVVGHRALGDHDHFIGVR